MVPSCHHRLVWLTIINSSANPRTASRNCSRSVGPRSIVSGAAIHSSVAAR
jgi:hypothetical protein